MNAGLRQRIPHRIHFDNYTREQLFEIFKLNLKEGFEFDDKFLECSKKYFLNLKKEILESKEFGNARFVRNLIERVRMKALMRAEFSDISEIKSIKLMPVDLETAICDKDIAELNKNKSNNRRIGF